MFKRFLRTVRAEAVGWLNRQKASGSGVIISSDGYIVTNNHVVNGATDIIVTLNNPKNYVGKVVRHRSNTDLALVKIDGKDLPVHGRRQLR